MLLIILVVLAIIYRPGKWGVTGTVNMQENTASDSIKKEAKDDMKAGDNDEDAVKDEGDAKWAEDNEDGNADAQAEADNQVPTEVDAQLAANTKGFVEYAPGAIQQALADGKRVALFFHATRCPTCRALAKDIQAHLADIDTNTLIFQVDYDTQVALKQKYGVTSQHTIVYLDQNMEAEKISRGIPTLKELLANF